jgi:hypothetical protein
VIRENSRLDYDWRIKDEIIKTGVAVYNSHTASSTQIIHAVNTAKINYDLLATFILNCSEHHVQCNFVEGQANPLAYLKLIDCVDEEIVVPGPKEQRYLCLSYVWDNDLQERSSAPEDITRRNRLLLAKLPLTIQDSIRVVLNLGWRYLWVDRYCINQEDPMEKILMLHNMDQIYENAELTIVALHGDSDLAGLPGVSRVPREQQPRFDRSLGSLISSCPVISTVIADSKWATRGWTYQEARLSRRYLFFSSHQVYFVCKHGTMSEVVPKPPGSPWVVESLNSDNLGDIVARFGGDKSRMDLLVDDRLMFTQRTLTYPGDVLDACRGILARSTYISLWGVPIIPKGTTRDPSKGLALGLTVSKKPSCTLQPKGRTHTPAALAFLPGAGQVSSARLTLSQRNPY